MLLLIVIHIRSCVWVSAICLAAIVVLVYGNLMKQQASMIHHSGHDITINAEVDSFFKPNSFGYSGNIHILSIDQIKMSALIQPAVKLYSPVQLFPGDQVNFHVRVKPVIGLLNEAGFDSEKYYFGKHIVARLIVKEHSDFIVITPVSFRMKLYRAVAQLIEYNLNRPLLLALSFANRNEINSQFWQQLQETGLAHLIAISGLHIGVAYLLGFYLGAFFSRAQARLLWFPVITGVAVSIGYAWLAGFSLPTQRALCMIGIHLLFQLRQAQVSYGQRYLISLSILLTLDPFSCVLNSFWLSFLSVFFVLYFVNQSREEPAGIYQGIKSHFKLTICMMPVGSFFFGGISLLAPLYNLLWIPWFSFVIVPVLFLAIICSIVVPSVAVWLWQLTEYLLKPVIYSFNFSHHSWVYTSDHLTICMLMFVLVFLTRHIFTRRLFQLIVLLIGGRFVCGISNRDWQVDILDVGHGLAVLIEKNKHYVLYDTGKGWGTGSIAQSVIDPVLHHRGVDQLDGLILSHMDNDHAGGRKWIENNWHPLWKRSSQLLKNYLPCIQGESWDWQGLQFDVLWPPSQVKRAYNEHSCVIRVFDKVHHYSVMLTGDMTAENERQIRRHFPDLKSDILMVPHHGSQTSSTRQFIIQVHPQVAIASTGKSNPWHLPNARVRQRYDSLDIPWIDTGEAGQIRLTFRDGAPEAEIKTWRSGGFSPWYRQMLRKQVE
ncbi:DNA internalization-related competence protein ComEC/Rec2 [Vibrio aerogenes]|uniref:DNA internalization-related competence protein ComEC/Rec2 n=1 Tax=Vibrio aerogenes TaxID=92172 RepID=UPI001588244E|nr:DNA internalization-related competence protein ComEC/Rec2 [Vibrio aerogenes]